MISTLTPGQDKEDSYVLEMKPVVPFKLSNDWNLITRTVIPSNPSARPGAWRERNERAGRCANFVVLFTCKSRQGHLGCRASHFLADRNRRHSWNKETQHRTYCRCAEYPRALVIWSTGAKPILGGRTLRATRCKSNAVAALRELQHAARVVSNILARNYLELGSE